MAGDLTKAKEIAKAKSAFDATEWSILATEQGTIRRASTAFALFTFEADANYNITVDSAAFALLATSTAASNRNDARSQRSWPTASATRTQH